MYKLYDEQILIDTERERGGIENRRRERTFFSLYQRLRRRLLPQVTRLGFSQILPPRGTHVLGIF